MSEIGVGVWVGFNVMVLVCLAVDLLVFHKEAHKVSMKEAGTWTVIWIALALIFNVVLYFWQGQEAALQYLTGYLIEKSLSVDNLFVFAMIFSYFSVPQEYQHRVLFWGIVGALVMRGVMIAVGATLISNFHWVLYIFGAFLVYTGFKMLGKKNEGTIEPGKNPLVRYFRKVFPVTEGFEGQNLFVRHGAKVMATPLFLVLVVVETTDLVFALDSIPAIFAITQDPFIVYTSNVFAILGLRALYFLLANVIDTFKYLSTGLAIVLMFIGVKMLIEDLLHIPVVLSLAVVLLVIAISIIASVISARREALRSS